MSDEIAGIIQVMNSVRWFSVALFLCVIVAAPLSVGAHEVYVLHDDVIHTALEETSPNPFSAYWGNERQFYFWGFISLLVVSTLLCMTFFHVFEERAAPWLRRLKPWAPTVVRITLGLALIEFAYQGALFGPELPLHQLGALSPLVQFILAGSGALILAGWYVRYAVIAALLAVVPAVVVFGAYTITYVAYAAALLAVFMLESGKSKAQYAMPLLRVGFGFSVMAAAFYAKFLHSNLALATVAEYNLVHYFPFDPLFIVLGALIIETLIGFFILVGLEVRWTTLFFLFWLTLSLMYFQEAVWPHLALFGLNIAFFLHGYDRYSLEGWVFRKRKFEPLI